MRADYSPAPGTTAYRVIAHMETLPAGAEVMTSALAEAIGVPANNLTPCLEAAVNAGKLFRRQRDNHVRSPYWWSLTDRAGGQPPPKRQTVYVPDQDQRGVAQLAARRAHNPEVGGSNPPPASTLPPEPGPQQVLKAEAARPDATDRGAPDIASPGGGPTGAGQPAAAGPAGEGCRFALWSNGTLQIERSTVGGAADFILLSRDEVRQLVAYLEDPQAVVRGALA